MLSPFSCGSFSNQQEDDIEELLSPCSTPKRSKRSRDSKNPYAHRGLDKFYALLAELEDKKQKIYTQKGSEDISFVRFVYSSSNNWKPIVVKSKDKRHHLHQINHHDDAKNKHPIQSSESVDKNTAETSAAVYHQIQQPKVENSQSPQKKSINWSLKLRHLRKPCCYLAVMVILILFFLALYGRSFAILCTSLGWYLVPMIKEGSSSSSSSSNSEQPNRKKEYGRRFSEKITVNADGSSSPNSVLSGPIEKSPMQHAHRKSW